MKVPKEGSRRYKQIVKAGCKLVSTETDCGTEYDCYEYDWNCDSCPVVIEHERDKRRIA